MTARCALVIVVALAAAARGDDLDDAKRLYDVGLRNFDRGDYAEAIAAWREAYKLSRAPLMLFNIGQAYRLSGDCKHALVFYDGYLRAQPDPPNRNALEQAMELCKDARVEAPPLRVDAAPERVVVRAPPPPSPRPARSHARAYAIATASAGGVLALAAIGFALDGGAQQAAVANEKSWTTRDAGLQSRGQLDNALAWTCGAVGIVAVGVGAAVFALAPSNGRAHGIALVPTRGGAAVSMTRRF